MNFSNIYLDKLTSTLTTQMYPQLDNIYPLSMQFNLLN